MTNIDDDEINKRAQDNLHSYDETKAPLHNSRKTLIKLVVIAHKNDTRFTNHTTHIVST